MEETTKKVILCSQYKDSRGKISSKKYFLGLGRLDPVYGQEYKWTMVKPNAAKISREEADTLKLKWGHPFIMTIEEASND